MDKNPIARIAVNKSVLPTHQNKDVKIIFMEGNSEFEIEIFNPLTKKIAVDIQVNDVEKNSPLLVVRPGERIWLDCGLKNKKKFLFETYQVDGSKESLDAIKNNGDIIIKIYVEKEKSVEDCFDWVLPDNLWPKRDPMPINPYPPYPWTVYGPIYGNASDNTGNINFCQSNFASEEGGMSVNCCGSKSVNYSAEVEPGITMDGLETGMISEDFPGILRKKITNVNKSNELNWTGELYLDQNNEPTSVGFIMTSTDSSDYKGMYVNILIDDTINLVNNCTVELDITLPEIVYHPDILIGEFDKELTCIDTTYYAKPDSVGNSFAFKFRANKQGNNYLIGRLSNIDELVKDDIYFFKGFYVKLN